MWDSSSSGSLRVDAGLPTRYEWSKLSGQGASPRRCRLRTEGVTTIAVARRMRGGTNAGLAAVPDSRLANRQKQGVRRGEEEAM